LIIHLDKSKNFGNEKRKTTGRTGVSPVRTFMEKASSSLSIIKGWINDDSETGGTPVLLI